MFDYIAELVLGKDDFVVWHNNGKKIDAGNKRSGIQ